MCLTKSRCAINGNYGKQDADYCCCLAIKDLRHKIGARMAYGVHRFIFCFFNLEYINRSMSRDGKYSCRK